VKAVPGLIPGTDGDVDQVVRWQAFMDEHPSAVKAIEPPVWTGSIEIRGERRPVVATSLKGVIDALEALAEAEAGP